MKTPTAAPAIVAKIEDAHGIKASPGLRHYVNRKAGDGWDYNRILAGALRAGLVRDVSCCTHWSAGPHTNT